MSFVKMIIGLPLIVIIAVFAFVNNDMAVFSLWPFNMEITVSLSVAVIFFIVFGYIVGKLDFWLSYAPLRRALRVQQRQNKKLSREQQELAGKVESLKGDLENAKSKAEVSFPFDKKEPAKTGLKEKISNLFKRKQEKSDDFWCL